MNVNLIIRFIIIFFIVASGLTSSDLSGLKRRVNAGTSNAHNPNNYYTVHSHHLRNNYLDHEPLLPQH